MARKGILTLAGFFNSGGSVNVPTPNPPVPVEVTDTQTVRLPLLSNPSTVFPFTVTRTLDPPQSIEMDLVTNTSTVFAPTLAQVTRLPLVTNTSTVLPLSVSVAGAFTENFAGTDGANWDPVKWTNKRVTTAGIGDLQGDTGRLSTGTLGNYAGFAGYMTILSYADFELSGDYIVVGANVVYPMIGFRSSASWSTTHGSALDSYWLELKRNEFGTWLYKRTGNTPTIVGQNSNFSYSTGDTIHFRINVQGTVIRTRVWKNAETEPTQWDMTLVDTTHTAGRIYLSANGGPDNLADEVRFDNIVIVGGAVGAPPPPPPPPPQTTTLTRLGVTWTHFRPSAASDPILAVHDTQAQHIQDFGAGSNLSPSTGVYNWAGLDPFVQDMFDAGATKPIIILCSAPQRMRPNQSTNIELPPLPAFRSEWASICAAVAARYPNVKYFSYWNEMKGYWNDVANRWDYERYTADYNAVWNAVKAVRPDAKIGGPYVILQSGSTGTAWSHGPSTLTFPGGSHDTRNMAVMTYFRDNAVGFDFLSCDGGMENQFGTKLVGDPYAQLQKLWGWWVWVRQNIHPTCELFNFETYVQYPWYPISSGGLGWSKTQIEDLMIELARRTVANVPNPNVSYLVWQAPQYPPQVVNGNDAFVYFNTENTSYRNKVIAWHGTTTPPPPTTTDLLTLWSSRYPATGAEVSVNPGGVQAAINAASAGTTIRLLPGTYNDAIFNWSGKNGTQTNWIRMRCDPGVVINVNGGNFGQGLSQLKNCSFIAIYGGEWVGVNNAANQYEVAHLMQQGAHSCAVWGGTYHDMGGHFFAAIGGSSRFDVCYNRGYRLANWNETQASAISCIAMTNLGTAWSDGYMNHIVGNVIDATWTDPSRHPTSYFLDPAFVPSDGNGIIFDVSPGYTGRSLVAHNLVVGCGGRGIHTLDVDNVDMFLNTCLDNSQNLAGSWIGEISITDSSGCRAAWNLAAARPGSNRVGVFQNPGNSTWSDTGFLRGTGGSQANDPSVSAFNNVNLTAIGPAAYFNNYQPGVHTQVSITSVVGFRPKIATVSKFTPPSDVRAAVSPWPDALGVLRPTSGDWARGAFEGA